MASLGGCATQQRGRGRVGIAGCDDRLCRIHYGIGGGVGRIRRRVYRVGGVVRVQARIHGGVGLRCQRCELGGEVRLRLNPDRLFGTGGQNAGHTGLHRSEDIFGGEVTEELGILVTDPVACRH